MLQFVFVSPNDSEKRLDALNSYAKRPGFRVAAEWSFPNSRLLLLDTPGEGDSPVGSPMQATFHPSQLQPILDGQLKGEAATALLTEAAAVVAAEEKRLDEIRVAIGRSELTLVYGQPEPPSRGSIRYY